MAGVSAISTSELECPVCHEDYAEPTILPCNHRACRQCLISWLAKGGGQGGCPLCCAPILPPPTHPGRGDPDTLVDTLTTDLSTMALVEGQRVLRSPHICVMCQNSVAATSYCIQCDIKLCQPCTRYHQKLPASQGHTLEQLSKLSAEQLAAVRRLTCNTHPDRSAELFCTAHQALICVQCSTGFHGICYNKRTIGDMGPVIRAELRERAQRLREDEAEIAMQIMKAKDKLSAMRRKVKDEFDDLLQCVERQRDEVNDMIQAEEVAFMSSLPELANLRAALTSNAADMEKITESVPDLPLLGMVSNLTSRLNSLESLKITTPKILVQDISLDSLKVNRLQDQIFSLVPVDGTRAKAAGATFTVKFNPPSGKDTMSKSGVTTNINTRHQCITAMKEYQNRSLEELRFEYYRKRRRTGKIDSFIGQTTPATEEATNTCDP